jgi:hypothetical protein
MSGEAVARLEWSQRSLRDSLQGWLWCGLGRSVIAWDGGSQSADKGAETLAIWLVLNERDQVIIPASSHVYIVVWLSRSVLQQSAPSSIHIMCSTVGWGGGGGGMGVITSD